MCIYNHAKLKYFLKNRPIMIIHWTCRKGKKLIILRDTTRQNKKTTVDLFQLSPHSVFF